MRKLTIGKIGVFAAVSLTLALAVACGGPAHEHTYSSAWAFDTESHWHPSTCSHDTKANKSAHSFTDVVVPATVTSAGYTLHVCSCGYSTVTEGDSVLPSEGTDYRFDDENHWHPVVNGEPQKSSHDFEVTTVAPTCTSAGYTKHACKVCSYWYATDPTAPTAHHTDNSVFGYDNNAHWHVCVDCGTRVGSTEAHTLKVSADGSVYTCTTCGFHFTGANPEGNHHFTGEGDLRDNYQHWLICEDEGCAGEKFFVADHVFAGGNTCLVCGYEITDGSLSYRLNAEGTGYIVDGIGGAEESGAITIPDTYGRPANVEEGDAGTEKPVVEIAEDAFRGKAITSVTIGKNVELIGESAFRSCESLTSVTIGEGVRRIGANAFRASGLTSVTVPVTVDKVGDNAFYDCKSLANITVGAKEIGKFAFSYTGVGRTLESPVKQRPAGVPSSVTLTFTVEDEKGTEIIGSNAFQYVEISTVTLPETLVKIGMYAFAQTDLTAIGITDNVVSIGEYAFYGCELTSATFPEGSVWKAGGKAIEFTLPHEVDPDDDSDVEISEEDANAANAKLLLAKENDDDTTYVDYEWVKEVTE